MSSVGREAAAFDLAAYEQAAANVAQLRQKLPQKAVERLALEVVSRLAERTNLPKGAAYSPPMSEVDALCRALLSDDDQAGAQIIVRAQDEGASIDLIYLGYLARAAQRLGEWWDNDEVSFIDVTLGVGRVYAIMRGLRPMFLQTGVQRRRTATFAAVPGETHLLGITMAADLFRKDGWDITLHVGLGHNALLAALADDENPIVGLSCSGEHSTEALVQLVVGLRINNPHRLLLLSGTVVNAYPDLVSTLAPDGVATDVDSARSEMSRLLTVLQTV